MRRKTPCFVATEDVLVASGLQPDRHGLKQALWEHAANVYFAQGKVRRKKPAATAYSGVADPVRGIGQQHADDGGRWLWSGMNKHIYRWEFGAPELIDAAYGTYRDDQAGSLQPTIYDFTAYGNWMIVNDGVAPFIHKPGTGTPWAAWAGEVPQAALRYMKVMNFMLAIGYGTRGTRVGWSDADGIDVWTAAEENLAGSFSIDEFDAPIRAGERLGSYIACYSENQMGLVSYVGRPFVFGQKLSLDGIGAIGKAAVATDLRQNVGVGRNGCWWTDGNSYDYIDQGFLHDYLQDEVNWDQGGKIVCCRNEATGCFEFHFPMRESNDINEAWSWDSKSKGWSPTTPASFKAQRRLFNFPIVGTNGGAVQWDDYSNAVGGYPLELRTKPIMLQAEDGTNLGTHIVSHVDELELLLTEATAIEVRVGCGDDVNGDWEWTEWLECEVGNRIVELTRLPENPLWKVEFRSRPGVDDWRFNLQGLLLYGPQTGTKYEK
jgi:hypothetical protein